MNVSHMHLNESPLDDFSIQGSGYSIQEDRVNISIEKVSNNRLEGNISGSLSLELWALPNRYIGEGFSGELLAVTALSPIIGQHYVSFNHYDLPFTAPSVGQWNIVLMLREWDGVQYITRDYVNFDALYTTAVKPVVTRSTTDNVISVNFGHSDHAVTDVVSDQVITEVQARVSEESIATKKSVSKPSKPESAKGSVEKAASNKSDKVSINSASLRDLESIKGLPVKVAKLMYQTRPFKRLDELLSLKGMGPKLLKKIENLIKL